MTALSIVSLSGIGYAAHHFKLFQANPSRLDQLFMAGVECIPVLGAVVAIIERIAASIFLLQATIVIDKSGQFGFISLKASEEDESRFQALQGKNPYEYYTRMQEEKKAGRSFDPAINFLTLCPCEKVTPELRQRLEDESIKLLLESHETNKPLTVVSVGGAQGYQEAVYLAKLIKAGYTTIQLVIIDPKQAPCGVLSAFNDLSSSYNISILQYDHLDAYVQDARKNGVQNRNLRPDLLLLIDLTDKKYEVENKPLTDHAFGLLRKNELIKEGSVIAYSDLKWKNETQTATRTVIPGKYCGGVNLRALYAPIFFISECTKEDISTND